MVERAVGRIMAITRIPLISPTSGTCVPQPWQQTSAAGMAGVGTAQRSNVDTLQRLLCGRSIPVVMTVLTAVGTAACTVAVVSLQMLSWWRSMPAIMVVITAAVAAACGVAVHTLQMMARWMGR